MYPWLPWWTAFTKLPGAENLTQDIAPVTTWFPANFEMNFAGDPRIERDVVSNIASYGKQLGILTDALLTLAGDDTTHPEIQRLRDIAEKIEERKQTHRADLEQNAKAALERLKDADSEAFKRMLSSYIE